MIVTVVFGLLSITLITNLDKTMKNSISQFADGMFIFDITDETGLNEAISRGIIADGKYLTFMDRTIFVKSGNLEKGVPFLFYKLSDVTGVPSLMPIPWKLVFAEFKYFVSTPEMLSMQDLELFKRVVFSRFFEPQINMRKW
jgi:hypothetical protein